MLNWFRKKQKEPAQAKRSEYAQCPDCGSVLLGVGEMFCRCGGRAMAGTISRERADKLDDEERLKNEQRFQTYMENLPKMTDERLMLLGQWMNVEFQRQNPSRWAHAWAEECTRRACERPAAARGQ